MALEGALAGEQEEEMITIAVDSQAAIAAGNKIENSSRATTEEGCKIASPIHQLRRKGKGVWLVWLKSHIGMEGNEVVDVAAKEGEGGTETTVVTSGEIR